jgi:transposase-like protein
MDAADLNLSSIASCFSDEAEAYRLVESIRWPNGPVCPHCGVIDRAYHLKNQKTRCGKVSPRSLWKCKDCRRQFTVTIGTIFEDSHIPLAKWLLGAFLMNTGKNGISSHELSRSLNITIKAAWFMSHRLRHAMERIPSGRLLTGIVEADETYVGGKRRHIKGLSNTDMKVPVVTLVERDGEVRSQVMPTVNRDNLKAHLTGNVDASADLKTDESRLYRAAGKEFVSHETVDHSKEEWARGKAHVNTAEGYFSQLKRSIDGTHHHVSAKHLHRYVAEFDHRYNSRSLKDGERTVQTIRQSRGRRLTYRKPTGEPEEV